MFVGSIYSNPELLVEYIQLVKSKYDFYDESTRFFYDCAETMYQTRSQEFKNNTIVAFMSEDKERLDLFKKYGGIKLIDSWKKLSQPENQKNYYDILKKYSLLREYQRKGFDITGILKHSKFETFTANDIYRLVRGKTDKIHTVILGSSETEVLNKGTKKTLLDHMAKPSMGLPMPFSLLSEVFRGMKLKTLMVGGMVSNAGKTRFMVLLIAYIALVLRQKVYAMVNEMDIAELRDCLICTVINNSEFQALHGFDIKKNESELDMGLYRDKNGDFIYRKANDEGEPLESDDDFIRRVEKNSDEFNQIMQVAEWIDSELQTSIFVDDVSDAYDDKTLEFKIRKAKMTLGCNYWFYDTFKSDTDDTGDWAAMMNSATKLATVAKETETFGYLSIQLLDEIASVDPDRVSSTHIANCKAIKRVMYTMMLFKEILANEFSRYEYLQVDEDWGEPQRKPLQEGHRYYCCNVDKNRFGRKPKVLFELDLDKNTWRECGELVRK